MKSTARFWSRTACLALLCLAAPAAIAVPITYVFSGPATGTLGATPFTGAQVTVTGVGDTAGIVLANPGIQCLQLTSVMVTITGVGSATATGPNVVFSNNNTSVWGYTNGTCPVPAGDWLDVSNALAGTYALATSIGPSTGAPFFLGGSVATTGGTLTFTSDPLTFQATLGSVGPIPTLSPWALLLLGVLIAGAAFFLRGQRPANG